MSQNWGLTSPKSATAIDLLLTESRQCERQPSLPGRAPPLFPVSACNHLFYFSSAYINVAQRLDATSLTLTVVDSLRAFFCFGGSERRLKK